MTSSVPNKGVLAALWLPTDARGALLRAELEKNLTFLKRHRIDGLLALGSTGEFPQLDLGQRKHALEVIVELAAPLPVIANVSDIRPKAVAEMGRFARRLGLPAITIMAPGFFPLSQEDLLAHFLHGAEAAELPTILYNFPDLTGTKINLETVGAFAERANLAGVKQSGREFEFHKQLIALGKEKHFSIFSGADTRLPEVFALGADGCIGGLVNFVPELMVHLYRVCHDQQPGSIFPAQHQMQEIGRMIDRVTFPLSIAAGMEARGFGVGVPKAVVSPRTRKLYREIVADLSALFAAWGLSPASP